MVCMDRNVIITGKSSQIHPFQAGDGTDLDSVSVPICFTRRVQDARRHKQLEHKTQQQEWRKKTEAARELHGRKASTLQLEAQVPT